MSGEASTVAARSEPRGAPGRARALTIVSALVLLGLAGWSGWRHFVESPLAGVASPERALALIVGRTMDLDDAVERRSGLARRLYGLLLTEGSNDVVQALAWYEELAARSDDPAVEVQLAVLEGEAGRLSRLRERTDAWANADSPIADLAPIVRAAYLGGDLDPADLRETADDVQEVLPPGWFRDRLALRLAMRLGDDATVRGTRRLQATRVEPVLTRARRLVAVDLATLLTGALALVTLEVRRRRQPGSAVVGPAALPPPWGGRAGIVVLCRGGAAGVILVMGLPVAAALAGVEHPALEPATVAVSALPVILLARRELLAPRGLARGWGMWPVRPGLLGLWALALIAVGTLIDLLLGLAGSWTGGAGHWTEWFDADLAWGTPLEAASSLASSVVVAPVVEEVVFRGLLFATLRRRLPALAAATVSGAVFALAHGYGLMGFLSVFASGVLWAWAYERSGSLLPAIVAHAANNFVAALAVLWLLRA